MPKVIKRKPARDARVEALQLLGKWASLGRAHVLMGASCSCGLGGASQRVEEFEQQILDYLGGKHGAAGNDAVTHLLREPGGYQPGKSGSLGAVLRAIATQPASGDSSQWILLLDDVKRTLDSFDELHRSR